MALLNTPAQTYAAIKNLENSNQIILPAPQETIQIGVVDPAAGTFQWSVPTLVKTITSPPPPGSGVKTNTIIHVTMGTVFTKAVGLRLKFAVVPVKTSVLAQTAPAQIVQPAEQHAAPAPAKPEAGLTAVAHVVAVEAQTAPKAPLAPLEARLFNTGTVTLGESNGGVTITGFPTVSSDAEQITIDVGLSCSAPATDEPNASPQFTSFAATVNIPGHPEIGIQFYIVRPPIVGAGVFTLPALPIAIVYAPPQGKQLKNTVTYSDTTTFSRSVTTSVASSTSSKTAQAYSVGDLIGKVADIVTAIVGVAGGAGVGAGAAADAASISSAAGAAASAADAGAAIGGASVASGLDAFVSGAGAASASAGAASGASGTLDTAKEIGSGLKLVSDILSALDMTTSTTSGVLTAQTDTSVTLTLTNMSTYGSESGLGPGVGDRIVYMNNVQVAWLAVNGNVGISVFGYDGIGANSVQDLQGDLEAITSGGTGKLGLSTATIKSLLSQDVLVPPKSLSPVLATPVVGPPRFVPASPPGRNGSGTTSSGDAFVATYDVTNETKQTNTSSQTTITDAKPGWLGVLFGEDDTETTTTAVLTTNQVTDSKAEDKLTTTITLSSTGLDDKYNVLIFYDNLFGTYVILDAQSPLLLGDPNDTKVTSNPAP